MTINMWETNNAEGKNNFSKYLFLIFSKNLLHKVLIGSFLINARKGAKKIEC